MRVVKICGGIWENASRDKRELSVCCDLGAEAIVVAKGQAADRLREDEVDGYKVLHCTTRPLGERFPKVLNRLVSLFIWTSTVKTLQADIITGENLTGTLIGWMSTWFVPKANKPKLVYDSHEFEIGRNTERSRLTVWLITHLERFLMKRCAFSIMVNDTIADEVQRIHSLKKRPLVVRNIAPLWNRDDAACAQVRRELCKELNVHEGTFLVMHHGGVQNTRGIENMMHAIALTPEVVGIILGNGEATYIESLKLQAVKLGIAERVLFHPAVPIDVLKNYVGAVDCGLVILKNVCINHYYSLPNKFFENIQSETPIIGSNFPEIARIVNQYQLGLLCDPSKPEEIAECITKMQGDKAFYQLCKNNTKIAKQELCWERERAVLELAYAELM